MILRAIVGNYVLFNFENLRPSVIFSNLSVRTFRADLFKNNSKILKMKVIFDMILYF